MSSLSPTSAWANTSSSPPLSISDSGSGRASPDEDPSTSSSGAAAERGERRERTASSKSAEQEQNSSAGTQAITRSHSVPDLQQAGSPNRYENTRLHVSRGLDATRCIDNYYRQTLQPSAYDAVKRLAPLNNITYNELQARLEKFGPGVPIQRHKESRPRLSLLWASAAPGMNPTELRSFCRAQGLDLKKVVKYMEGMQRPDIQDSVPSSLLSADEADICAAMAAESPDLRRSRSRQTYPSANARSVTACGSPAVAKRGKSPGVASESPATKRGKTPGVVRSKTPGAAQSLPGESGMRHGTPTGPPGRLPKLLQYRKGDASATKVRYNLHMESPQERRFRYGLDCDATANS